MASSTFDVYLEGTGWSVKYCDWAFEFSRFGETASSVQLCAGTVSCLGIEALGIVAFGISVALGIVGSEPSMARTRRVRS